MPNEESPHLRPGFKIKIDRHALPRRALGRADIARRGGENILPCPPLSAARHAIERDCFR
jgi:hypothetical protein